MPPHLYLGYIGDAAEKILTCVGLVVLAWIGAVIATLVMAYRIWVTGPKSGQRPEDMPEYTLFLLLFIISTCVGGLGVVILILSLG